MIKMFFLRAKNRWILVVCAFAFAPFAEAQYTDIQYLSGTDKDHTVPWQFYMTGGGRSNNVADNHSCAFVLADERFRHL
jgi:hypothetical protein